MKMTNRTYDVLKWVALVALPAIQVFWLAIGKIWGIPLTVEIGATIAAVDVLLGSLLGVSGHNYNQTAEGIQDTFNDENIYEMMETDDEDQNDTAEEQ